MKKHIYLILEILRFINKFIHKKNNKIMFYSYPDYSDNSKALYEYIKKYYKNKYDLVWIVSNYNIANKLNYLGIKAYSQWSLKGILAVTTSKYIISTHRKFELMKSKSQIYINLWHGMPLKKMGFLEDKENINNKELNILKKSSENINYMIVTSNIMKYVLSSCFYIDPSKVLTCGQPRNDYLINSDGKKYIQEMFSDIEINNYSKILMYIPTFKNGLGRIDSNVDNNKLIDILNYDYDELERFLYEKEYLLVIKLHPREEKMIKEFDSKYIKIIRTNYMNEKLITLNEILNVSDLLITDYSSVYFDYLLLEKPILFINTDEEEYKRNRGFVFEDINIWRPGPKVKEFDNLKSEVYKLINDKDYFRKERSFINSLVNENKLGFCESIFNEIFGQIN